jgi:pSer/pThr/pTyr-binding forkhead associated (FHA) protein
MTVSRQHCLIELEGGSAWVQDLGSLNGTHVNGQKIGQPGYERQADATWVAPARQELQDGDELRVCHTVFAVVLSDCPCEPLAASTEGHQAAPPTSAVTPPAAERGPGPCAGCHENEAIL